jgi:hypothetical protein
MFQLLSGSLQTSIRFFFHPLPSWDFCLRYLWLTRSIHLPDLVGLTLLIYPVLSFSFRCWLFCGGICVHTIARKNRLSIHPLAFWREPISPIWLFNEWRSLDVNSFTFIIRKLPLAPFPQFWATWFGYFRGLHSIPTGDVTRLNRVFYVRVRGVKPLTEKVPRSGWPFPGRAFLFVPLVRLLCSFRCSQFDHWIP